MRIYDDLKEQYGPSYDWDDEVTELLGYFEEIYSLLLARDVPKEKALYLCEMAHSNVVGALGAI